MLCEIIKDESSAALRKVPVFLQSPGGAPYSGTLAAATITFRKPGGAGGEIDVSGAIAAVGSGTGRWEITLTTGQVDTAGNGWIDIVDAGITAEFHDYVRITNGNADVVALLPTALDGGFMKAQVKGIDATPRDAIAGAVWDVAIGGHVASGSFGELLQIIAALVHHNGRIDNITFDADHLLTAGRLRCFASASAANSSTPGASNNADGETRRFTISATSTGSGEFSTWLLTRTL